MNRINNLTINTLRGVGTVELSLADNQRVYSIIGENGIGKTKLLEALFQFIIYQHDTVIRHYTDNVIYPESTVFKTIQQNSEPRLTIPKSNFFLSQLTSSSLSRISSQKDQRTQYA